MQSAKTPEERLQMLFDGELAPDEEASVRRDLESSPEAQAQLQEWEQLRGAMRDLSRQWGGAIDSDALFARIEAEIEAPAVEEEHHETPAPVELPPLRVVPGRRERRVWGAVATGFAAAAAIFLAVVVWPGEPGGNVAEMARGTEVLEVDFGANTGTIFNVEGGAGESIAVVWIVDEGMGMP